VALDVTGQNIANVNTNDYTRQSADLVSVNYTAAKSRLADTNGSKSGRG
jgi:flagellar hook-associated protein FlgK